MQNIAPLLPTMPLIRRPAARQQRSPASLQLQALIFTRPIRQGRLLRPRLHRLHPANQPRPTPPPAPTASPPAPPAPPMPPRPPGPASVPPFVAVNIHGTCGYLRTDSPTSAARVDPSGAGTQTQERYIVYNVFDTTSRVFLKPGASVILYSHEAQGYCRLADVGALAGGAAASSISPAKAATASSGSAAKVQHAGIKARVLPGTLSAEPRPVENAQQIASSIRLDSPAPWTAPRRLNSSRSQRPRCRRQQQKRCQSPPRCPIQWASCSMHCMPTRRLRLCTLVSASDT
jgi:hypothetical protein